MKRFSMALLGALVLVLVLAACAPAPVTDQPEPEETEAPTTDGGDTGGDEETEEPSGEETETPTEAASGVDEITILTFVGPQVAEPLQRRAPDFTAETGIKVNVVTVPNSDLYQKALTDMATGTNSYDGFLFAPSWIVDFAPAGYLTDLTDWVNEDQTLKWDDVAPFFRDFNSYDGRVYSMPLDGDFHMMYYRSDLIDTPPATWDEYLEVAAEFQGQDLNDDGEPDYGSCISKAKAQQAYWFIYTVAGPYIQSQGSSEGAFFDLETMEPLVNNEAFKRALEVYKETGDYGPPDELNLGVGDTRGLFLSGRCALALDWGDIGTLALDETQSKVRGITGSSITPGSTQVLDRATGELVDCDETTCPYAIDGVNYAPFAAFGGWAGAVNAAQDEAVQRATYEFFAYMVAPEQGNVDVTIGASGYNPYRISQFEEMQPWLDAGFTEDEAAAYLGAIKESLDSPNMILDLRVPGNHEYQQVELDRIIASYLAGELTTDEAAQELFDAWEAITEDMGRDAQLAAYLATIGAGK
jgi:multiple sugar transport system substrate-binding protein